VALMMSTAGVPVTLQIASLLLPQLPGWVTWTLVATSGASLLASLRERDLRRAVARWLLALAAVALATLGKLPPEDRRVIGCMLITGALTASTACTFLAGLVAQSCGHTEISRLRGLASRAAGVFGWMVLAVLLLSGAPPGAVFTAMLVCPAGVPVELAILLPVAAGVTLAVVHRTFLGLPTDFTSDSLDDPATIRISGRQRLALLLLISASLAATLAPATLLRP
jgi:formate hydrogenlyase subunit 3/multisubunit Na+/H+ antiporter MnhD subunit